MPSAKEIAVQVARILQEPPPDYSGEPNSTWPREEILKRLREEEEARTAEQDAYAPIMRAYAERTHPTGSPATLALREKLKREMEAAGYR